MSAPEDDDLIAWLERIHREAHMRGWDFSVLDGRLSTDDPPWDFAGTVRTALITASTAVDVGTGGGEVLGDLVATLGDARPRLWATEGWPPNQPIARERLEPLGVTVLDYDPEVGGRMPLDDESMGLVIVRHEAIDAAEFARVLRPGGVLLTQQVDGRDAEELRAWFGGESLFDTVTLPHTAAVLADAGLTIEEAEEWTGEMRFRDVATLVEYIAMVPWDVPDFEVRHHADALRTLADRRPIVMSQRRFRIRAVKPPGS